MVSHALARRPAQQPSRPLSGPLGGSWDRRAPSRWVHLWSRPAGWWSR